MSTVATAEDDNEPEKKPFFSYTTGNTNSAIRSNAFYTNTTGNMTIGSSYYNTNVSTGGSYTCFKCSARVTNGIFHQCGSHYGYPYVYDTTYYYGNSCKWCNVWGHDEVSCPRVETIEYYKDGTIKSVKFFKPE